MLRSTWKNIEEISYKNFNKNRYAYEISYIIPFGVDLSLYTTEHIMIVSNEKLSDDAVIERAAERVTDRFVEDDEYDLIPESSLLSITITNRYCPASELE